MAGGSSSVSVDHDSSKTDSRGPSAKLLLPEHSSLDWSIGMPTWSQEMAPAGAEATAMTLLRAAEAGTYIVAPFLLGSVSDMDVPMPDTDYNLCKAEIGMRSSDWLVPFTVPVSVKDSRISLKNVDFSDGENYVGRPHCQGLLAFLAATNTFAPVVSHSKQSRIAFFQS